MSTNKWKEIWNKKEVSLSAESDEYSRFCELKVANGFDVAVDNKDCYYRSFYNGWLDFYDKLTEIIGDDISGVYEVGCGSGVNLFMFKNRLQKGAVLGGMDYSASLLDSARSITQSDDILCCGANEIVINPKYDVVMSESVFQYFESLEYAQTVLEKMIQKSNKLTYLGEVHNKAFEQELLDYRRKTIENYDEKYAGLNKLFFEKSWIEKIASKYGKKVLYTEVDNPEYINGKYEFNCFIY